MRGSILILALVAPGPLLATPQSDATARVLAGLQRLALARPPSPADARHRAALLAAFRESLAREVPQALTPMSPILPERAAVSALSDRPPPRLRPGEPAVQRSGVYRLPVGGRVIAGTGETMASGWRTRGLTLAPAPGAGVVAPASGRVAFAGSFRGYGGIVILDHGHGWTTLLTGLARIEAQGGDALVQGDRLGRVGAQAPRLTIELRHRGRPIDVVAMALS